MDHWVNSISAAVGRQDGHSLSSCFALLSPSEGKWLPPPAFVTSGQTSQLPRVAAQRLDGPWADACVEYAGCYEAFANKVSNIVLFLCPLPGNLPDACGFRKQIATYKVVLRATTLDYCALLLNVEHTSLS